MPIVNGSARNSGPSRSTRSRTWHFLSPRARGSGSGGPFGAGLAEPLSGRAGRGHRTWLLPLPHLCERLVESGRRHPHRDFHLRLFRACASPLRGYIEGRSALWHDRLSRPLLGSRATACPLPRFISRLRSWASRAVRRRRLSDRAGPPARPADMRSRRGLHAVASVPDGRPAALCRLATRHPLPLAYPQRRDAGASAGGSGA